MLSTFLSVESASSKQQLLDCCLLAESKASSKWYPTKKHHLFTSISGMAGGDVPSSFLVTVKHHGILMILSWGLLLPLAAAFSFWLRRTPSTRIAANPSSNLTFFRIHYMLAGTGAILAIAGWVIASRNFSTMKWTDNMHGILGTIVMVGAVINILLYPAMGKPVEETRTARQNVVALFHTYSGYTLIVLSWITCYLAARYATTYLQGLIACWTSVVIVNIGLYFRFKKHQWTAADNIALEDESPQQTSTTTTGASLSAPEHEQQLLLPQKSHEQYA